MPSIESKVKKTKRKIAISDEERERRRENVKALTKQGRMGGKFGTLGGRPRKPRAAQRVAELASEHAEEIAAAFLDSLDPENVPYVRLQAAKEWLKVEHDESKLQLEEDKTLEDASKDEIIEFLAGAILSLEERGAFPGTIEGTIVEDEPSGLISSGSTSEET